MTEPLPGIELFLSTEKAAAEAERYKAAANSAADAVLRIGDATGALQTALDSVTGKGLATGLRESSSAADDLAKALDDIVAQKRRELDLGNEANRDRQKRLVSLEAEKKLGREMTEQEKASAALAASEIGAYRERLRLRRGEVDVAALSRKSEEERQRRVAGVTQAYQDQLSIAKAVGLQQDIIRATIKATNDAKALGLGLDSESAKRLREIAVETVKASNAAKLREESERRANQQSIRSRAATFEVRGAAEAVAGARKIEDALASAGRTAVSASRQVLAFASGLGVAVGVTGATRAFADYEDKLAILGTVSGATARQLRDLEAAAIDVSRSTRFSPREALQGLTELARAGFTSEQAIAAIKPTADLARAGLISLSDASTVVFQTLSQFELSAGQSARVADVLAKAAGSSTANVATLADSLAKAAPIASQLGVSLEDTVALLTVLADKGIAPAIAGTGLGRILLQLQTPTEEAQRSLVGLGLSLDKIAPKTVTAGASLRNLANANISLQDATSLVGTEFAGLLTILTDGVTKADRVGEALRSAGGEAAKQAAAGADSLAASFKSLANASERFTASALNGGIGDALKVIVNTGAEVFDVLGRDEKKMAEASLAARALAASLQVAAVAGAAFGAAKIAGQLQAAIVGMRSLTAATIAYEAATGTSIATASRASKAISGLWAAMKANPLVSIASGIGAVVSAFYLFGDGADDATAKAEKQRDALAKLEDRYKTYAEVVALAGKVSQGAGQFEDKASQEAAIRESNARLQEIGKRLDEIKGKEVKLDEVLGASAFAADSEKVFNNLRALFEEFRKVKKTASEIEFIPNVNAAIFEDFTKRFAAFGVTVDKAGEPLIDLQRSIQLVKDALAATDEQAKKVGVSLSSVGATADIAKLSSAVVALIAEREKELAISKEVGEAQLVLVLTEEAKKRKAVELNDVERKALADIAKRTIEIQKENEARRKATQEAERAADIQKELPAKLEELRRKYEQELILTRETGLARELMLADIEAENRAKEIGLGLDRTRAAEDAKALADLKERGREIARLEFDRRETKSETTGRVDTRKEALRELEEEEKLVRLVGDARENYRALLDAENAARQAGLVIGTKEYADYVKRKTAIAELGRTAEEVSQIFRDFGGAALASVEKLIDRTQKERDVVRALGEDLLRLAYRQTVVNNGLRLFETLGASFANLIGGGAAAGGTVATPPRSQPVAGYVPPGLGAQSLSSSLASSVFGQEAEPRRKRVGFGALEVNQGGGDIINMSFPGVRNASDARATRATLGQRVRQLKSIDRKGARGLRPVGQ